MGIVAPESRAAPTHSGMDEAERAKQVRQVGVFVGHAFADFGGQFSGECGSLLIGGSALQRGDQASPWVV